MQTAAICFLILSVISFALWSLMRREKFRVLFVYSVSLTGTCGAWAYAQYLEAL